MIRDICQGLKPGTAVAHGPRFDIHRVMDAGFDIFRAFAAAMPEGDPELLMRCGPFTGWSPFSEDMVLLQKMEVVEEANRYDVSETHISMRVGSLDIGFSPFGGEALVRKGGEWLNSDREPASSFDHVPKMTIMRAFRVDDVADEDWETLVGRALGRTSPDDDGRPLGNLLLGSHELRYVHAALDPFEKKLGIEVSLGPVTFVRFPHDRFGDGEGTLRIEVYDH